MQEPERERKETYAWPFGALSMIQMYFRCVQNLYVKCPEPRPHIRHTAYGIRHIHVPPCLSIWRRIAAPYIRMSLYVSQYLRIPIRSCMSMRGKIHGNSMEWNDVRWFAKLLLFFFILCSFIHPPFNNFDSFVFSCNIRSTYVNKSNQTCFYCCCCYRRCYRCCCVRSPHRSVCVCVCVYRWCNVPWIHMPIVSTVLCCVEMPWKKYLIEIP